MSIKARELNGLYLSELANASKDEAVLMRVRELWWPSYLKRFAKNSASAINALDLSMDDGRNQLHKMASAYAAGLDLEPNTAKHTQRVTQFLKSNTGKMFERFVGLAIAHALKEADAPYCILPFRSEMVRLCHGAEKDWFAVQVKLGEKVLQTPIDADLFAFNPDSKTAEIFLISIKSTLKDRFHSVPFWNLLRTTAITGSMSHVSAVRKDFLKKLRYVVVCSDLAEEQPDFSAEAGPRNLIALDAALLDGAYVSASKAKGLGSDALHLGTKRNAAFYPLSSFLASLST
jgi:hypothetical protein